MFVFTHMHWLAGVGEERAAASTVCETHDTVAPRVVQVLQSIARASVYSPILNGERLKNGSKLVEEGKRK